MIEIDTKWLTTNGVIASNNKTLEDLVKKAEAELEWRVGKILCEKLTDKQIQAFEAIEDEDKRLAWLEKAYPSYKKVVGVEYKNMSQEIKKSNDKTKLIKSWKQPE